MTHAVIAAEADPLELGLDPARLERITAHLDRAVDDGRFAGWLCAVARGGLVGWVGAGGLRDEAKGLAVEPDTIWRIFSMSKPITALAALMLHEEGRFDLTDELSRYLPEFAEPRVYVEGPPDAPVTRPASSPILVWHVLTHTAGLTYGFQRENVVDEIYRERGYDFHWGRGRDLAQACEDFASMPLVFDPGTAWNYSVATDVVGRLIEVLSGQPLHEFLEDRVFSPLSMTETGFFVPPERHARLAELYLYAPGDRHVAAGAFGRVPDELPRLCSGGGGLASTAHDYHRFATMLLRGGELGGQRLVAPSTLGLMGRNHLPGDVDLEAFAIDSFSEVQTAGMGYGLGIGTVIDAARLKMPVSEGTVTWGGAATTTFWADPAEDLSCVFFTQLLPSSSYQIRRELQRLVYAAITD